MSKSVKKKKKTNKFSKKFKKIFKGFTLVELLAVIVILAIIMIIAIPSVLNTMDTAQKKSFEEYVLKSINLAEKQELTGNLMNNTNSACTIYNIKKDFGLSTTGSYDGYVLVNTNSKTEYTITMWNDTRMLLPYNYTKNINSNGESKSIIDSIITYDESRQDELSKDNLCSYGCGVCSASGETITISCDYSAGKTWDFDYSGEIKEFKPSCSGLYKLEVWGASGGNAKEQYRGGYGAYSVGTIQLSKNTKIYVTVGGKGEDGKASGVQVSGGFNGGGKGQSWQEPQSRGGGGGGATHISYQKSLLKDLDSNKNSVIIVAGAGGGANYTNATNGAIAGNGGGFKGTPLTEMLKDATYSGRMSNPGTQSKGGCSTSNNGCGGFGYGGDPNETSMGTHKYRGGGGGAGYYGGSAAFINSGSGGSGYIGSSSLKEKHMACYACEESNETNTKTNSTTCVSNDPSFDCAKIGNGYATITYLG